MTMAIGELSQRDATFSLVGQATDEPWVGAARCDARTAQRAVPTGPW